MSGDATEVDVSARALGSFLGVLGLCLAVLTGASVNEIAHRHLAHGLVELSIVLGARWLSDEVTGAWSSRTARRLSQYWRARITTFFVSPSAGASPVELTTAIDTVVDGPRLELLRAGAQTSVLGLGLIWWAGGWQAAGIVVALGAIAGPLYYRAGVRSAALEARYHEQRDLLGERQLYLLTHAHEVRALGATRHAADQIVAASQAEHRMAISAIRTALGSSLITEFLGGVSVGLVAMDVGFGLLGGRLSLVRAIVCVLVTADLFGHVRRFGTEFHRREALEAASRALSSALLDPVSVTDGPVLDARDIVTVTRREPVSLRVEDGGRWAVLGPSGIGKTTLAHTVIGWRPVLEGHLARTTHALAYVGPDSALLEGTLRDNVTLGTPVSDERLLDQLSVLGLDASGVSDLDRRLSPDGDGLSSGERARVLLARALLSAPRLLILDDLGGLLDPVARDLVRREIARHPDLAVMEIAVDETIFISASQTLRLS